MSGFWPLIDGQVRRSGKYRSSVRNWSPLHLGVFCRHAGRRCSHPATCVQSSAPQTRLVCTPTFCLTGFLLLSPTRFGRRPPTYPARVQPPNWDQSGGHPAASSTPQPPTDIHDGAPSCGDDGLGKLACLAYTAQDSLLFSVENPRVDFGAWLRPRLPFGVELSSPPIPASPIGRSRRPLGAQLHPRTPN